MSTWSRSDVEATAYQSGFSRIPETYLKGFAQEVCPEVRVAQYWYAIHQDDRRQHFECFLLYIDRWIVKAGAIDTGEIAQAETPFLDALLQEDWSVS